MNLPSNVGSRASRLFMPALAMLALFAAAVLPVREACADAYMMDSWPNGMGRGGVAFPNWRQYRAASFDIWVCDSGDGCTGTEIITGLTVVNFGTASPSSFSSVYFKVSCGATASALITLTYAGIFTEDAGNYPAWTWAGSSPDMSGCPDLCAPLACGAYFTIDVYVDVAPCPENGETFSLGFPVHSLTNTTWWGSISDNRWTKVPWYDMIGDQTIIAYTYKEADTRVVVPGDMVTYTVYYGLPGTSALTNITIFDTQPTYTHYVFGSGSPAPDTFWDPNPGPPPKLRWTITPVTPNLPAWGPTRFITFQLTADWGNGDWFEPGSGDIAAPEGERLANAAQVFFGGTTCGQTSAVTPPVTTVVKRFYFWCIGDNDVLFSPTYGQPADEMLYSIYIKNVSNTKTWWDVQMWDSVPGDLDPWGSDCGFLDPCTGWTMTPSGCAPATPGKKVTAGTTMLTWRLDMPPGMTLELRWKAKVSSTAQAKGTVINNTSVMAYGRSGVLNGTGHSGKPRNFAHLAPIILPTMYTAYVGFGMASIRCPPYILFFEPLNKKTQFELRALSYVGAATWAGTGGVSGSIGSYLGSCITGFGAGGIAGCKAERIPALYNPYNAPDGWTTFSDANRDIAMCPDQVFPRHWIHKLTSNSPTLWQCLTYCTEHDQDNHTYTPATTLSFVGLMHYCWKRVAGPEWTVGWGDGLSMVNTSVNPYGEYKSGLETTVFIFQYNYPNQSWDFFETWDIGAESQAYSWQTDKYMDGPYRIMSSDGQLIINQGLLTNPKLNQGGHSDNEAAYMPTRETGNVVSMPGQKANFYGVHQSASQNNKVVIGNMGTADAVFRIWRYVPLNTTVLPSPTFPNYLNDVVGTWQLMGSATVPPGLATAGNPLTYPTDGAYFNLGTSSLVLSKVELISGGPIQVLHGIRVYSLWSGGAVMHAAEGTQTGMEFWLHYKNLDEADCTGTGCIDCSIYTIDVFCPKQGMCVNMSSGAGLTVTYTTTGPDQCISFVQTRQWPLATVTNYKISVLPNGNEGNVVAQFIANTGSEKGYTAPFLQEGIHYEIIAPPVAYVGQAFWITVIVKDTSGFTKADYTGITSFTSTDPSAKLEGTAMDSYNYTWSGCPGPCGVKMFMQVVMTQAGMQTIVAMDTLDGSINGLTAVMVVAADIKLEKQKKLSVASSGDQVQFRICWSNYSTGTGFTFVITDAVPNGTTYVPEVASLALCGWNGPYAPAVTMSYSTSTATSAAAVAFQTLGGTASATSTARWLRWTVRDVYVKSSGCVCFKVLVE